MCEYTFVSWLWPYLYNNFVDIHKYLTVYFQIYDSYHSDNVHIYILTEQTFTDGEHSEKVQHWSTLFILMFITTTK